MEYSINDRMEYVLSVTRRIPAEDLSAAVLAVLLSLQFKCGLDSFDTLRNAIVIKTKNPGMQMTDVYEALRECCLSMPDAKASEQAIRSCIRSAWKRKQESGWNYFFPEQVVMEKCPSNKEFVAEVASTMELWQSMMRNG